MEVALGWRARDVERRSTAPVHFPDRDNSAEVLERDPVVLVYADPAHGFTLPPGRFLDVRQTAGRVHSIAVTPHLAALDEKGARQLADLVARRLAEAGWEPTGERVVFDSAVAFATRALADGGTGRTTLGTWRLARSSAAWAALPAGARPPAPGTWNGAEAELSLRPLRWSEPTRSATEPAVRFIVQLAIDDYALRGALYDLQESRQLRSGGEPQTLTSWDR